MLRIGRAARALATTLALIAVAVEPRAHADEPEPSASAKPKSPEAAHHASKSVPAAPGAGAKAASVKAAPAKAAPKPAAKATPGNPKKGATSGKRTRKPGEAGEPDEAIRRVIAGAPPRASRESPELRAMRELDLALFPSAAPAEVQPWVAEGTPLIDRGEPHVEASGLPKEVRLAPPKPADKPADLSWLRTLAMPDIPVRWDARVVRYLAYYKDDPRGRSMVQSFIKKSGRYGGAIRRALREQSLPEDIVWLALVESGFDPAIHSPVGAAGLWQFMPDGARIYGLTVDRWIDERLDPERATVAAGRYLADLRQRFGSWELAFAAYNMGYGGLLAAIRKYNTNDFWELARLEAGMPLETALYVPKIIAMAIVARNKAVFGCDAVELEPAVTFDKLAVSPGVSLRSVALAAGTTLESLTELNPQLLANRAPPTGRGEHGDEAWTLRVPSGTAPRASRSLAEYADVEGKLERYKVRWGESLDEIASRRRISRAALQSLNGLRSGEALRPGTVLVLPAAPGTGTAAAAALNEPAPSTRPVVVVPARSFAYPDRRRAFYRVVSGDSIAEVARVFGVSSDEVCRWNLIDPGAALHEGMTLQLYVPRGKAYESALLLDEKDAEVLVGGSPAFCSYFEAQRGRARVEVAVREGDTFRLLAQRYGLTMGQLERINHRSRSSMLLPGDKLVVYVPSAKAAASAKGPLPPPEKAAEKADEAVAVAKPVDEESASPTKGDEEGIKPTGLVTAPAAVAKPAPPSPRVAADNAP